MTLGRNFPADATPSSSPNVHENGSRKDLASSTMDFNADSIHSKTRPHQSSANIGNFSSLEPPTIPALSDISTARFLSPNTNPHDLKPSRISDVSCVPALHLSGPDMTSTNDIEDPMIFTPHNYLAPATSNYKAPNPSDNPSHISNVRRTAQKLARANGLQGLPICTYTHAPTSHGPSDISDPVPFAARIRKDNIVQNVDPSGTCDPSHLIRPKTEFKSPEPSGSLIPCPLVPDTTRPNGPEPANISNKEDTAMDPIDQFTNINDDDPNTLEPRAGEYSPPQPVRDTGSVIPQPRRKYRKRQKPNVLPEELQPCQNKNRSKKKDSNGRRNNRSLNDRRNNPVFRYFCIKPTCQASLAQGARGFPKREEMGRHCASHEPPKFHCPLSHTPGGRSCFMRREGLRG